MNVYQIENSSNNTKELKSLLKVDLTEELHAVASNSVDRIAVGGENNKVDIHRIEGDGSSINLDRPELAMQFQSRIQRLQWVGGRYLIAYSENDSEVQIYNTESEAVSRFRFEGTAKNGSMDP